MKKKYAEGGNVTDSGWDEETNRRQIELGRLYDTPGMSSRGRGKVQLMEQSLPGMMHPEDTKVGAKQRAVREELRQALDRGEDAEIFLDQVVRRTPQRKSFKTEEYKKGGAVKASSSASRRGDGIASRGKTKGRMV